MAGLVAQSRCLHTQHTCFPQTVLRLSRPQRQQAVRLAAPIQAKAKPADELRALTNKELDELVSKSKKQLFYFRSLVAGAKKTRDRAVKSHEIHKAQKTVARALTIKTEREKEGARPL